MWRNKASHSDSNGVIEFSQSNDSNEWRTARKYGHSRKIKFHGKYIFSYFSPQCAEERTTRKEEKPAIYCPCWWDGCELLLGIEIYYVIACLLKSFNCSDNFWKVFALLCFLWRTERFGLYIMRFIDIFHLKDRGIFYVRSGKINQFWPWQFTDFQIFVVSWWWSLTFNLSKEYRRFQSFFVYCNTIISMVLAKILIHVLFSRFERRSSSVLSTISNAYFQFTTQQLAFNIQMYTHTNRYI